MSVKENASYEALEAKQAAGKIERIALGRSDFYGATSMDSCAEWLMLHTQNDYRYTEEQRKQSRERWLSEYPEIALLFTDVYWIEMRRIIERLPQQAIFHRP